MGKLVNEKTMYEKMAKINELEMEIGVGQALFDDPVNPTKRYFLEKRWGTGDKVFGAIMMNPSKAGALEGDETVDGLIKLAKAKNFSALYVVNIIPYICSSESQLPKEINNIITEPIQLKSMEFVLKESDLILLGWGRTGHKYLSDLLNKEEIKELFKLHKQKFKVVGLGYKERFPLHPRPLGMDRYKIDTLGGKFELKNVSKELESWINNASI